MKLLLIFLALCLGSPAVCAQDAPFTYQSPFGSDGVNQSWPTPGMRNAVVLDEIWSNYILARRLITKPLPKEHPGGYSQAQIDRWLMSAHYGHLLEAMTELRAFTTQNSGYTNATQKEEIARIDKVLRALNLSYQSRGGQAMADFCGKREIVELKKSLAPILFNADGTPRPLPPFGSSI